MDSEKDKLKAFQTENAQKRKTPDTAPGGIGGLVDKLRANLPKDMADKLSKAIADEMAIPPKIAIIGKAGVGKTTTINSLFNVEWHTSETITGTTDAQMETFQLKGEGKLSVVDMPGLGDSIARDIEFQKIYQDILPNVDVILYIIQADDRGLGEDERIIRDVVLRCGKNLDKKLVIGINKVDLLGENKGLEWDDRINLPSEAQEKLIDVKCGDIAKHLTKATGIKKEAIVYFSAVKYYHLYDLLYTIVSHSGQKGWKFSINPKDWMDLMDPKLRKKYEETRKGS